ncbi:MAG: BlaI/MecI/CopY family transcriptional regulator [Saprospiraceae bacterium]|nr:BlaI/MecI/CopY family transcriptional regulator [Saprospiraceae bacterium]
MEKLTQREEEIMRALWQLNKGFVKEIIELLPAPKPHYNTTSTLVRILEEKGFVDHNTFGKSHQYFPLISEEEYKAKFMKGFVNKYFKNSYKEMVTFFAKEENLSKKDLEEILKMIEKGSNE